MSFLSDSFVQHKNSQFVKREQNYVIDRKILTVHSEDRDVRAWPYANEFEITCPQAYTNVQSIKLCQINLPEVFYNFSNELENTKMTYDTDNKDISLNVGNGFYTYDNLATVLTADMSDNNITVKYSPIQHKFVFFSSSEFKLRFDKEETYDVMCIQNKKNLPYNKILWGLSYFLGFLRECYTTNGPSNEDIDQETFNNMFNGYIKDQDYGNSFTHTLQKKYGIDGVDVNGKKFIASQFPIPSSFYKFTIYMELDKFNYIDELKPYIHNSSSLCNYDYNGYINSAFAKMTYKNLTNINSNNNNNQVTNWETIYHNDGIITFDSPLERVTKLKFKFRMHNGNIVEFLNSEINFSLEIVQLRNDLTKNYNIYVPPILYFK